MSNLIEKLTLVANTIRDTQASLSLVSEAIVDLADFLDTPYNLGLDPPDAIGMIHYLLNEDEHSHCNNVYETLQSLALLRESVEDALEDRSMIDAFAQEIKDASR